MDEYFKLIEGVYLPADYELYKNEIDEMEVHDSDVWVITFPKSGTTWVQEAAWLLCNNLDFKKAKSTQLFARFPFLESSSSADWMWMNEIHPEYNEYESSVHYVKNMKGRRFIKSHLHWHLLPKQIQNGTKKPKIIYITRHPKDVIVSFYNFFCKVFGFDVEFGEFCESVMDNKIVYTPYWNHIWSYFDHSQDSNSNILWLKFEDLKSDLPQELLKLATFLDVEKPLAENEMKDLCDHLSFASMKKNNMVNEQDLINYMKEVMSATDDASFIRNGTVGDYKNFFDIKTEKIVDDWIRENVEKKGVPFDKLPVSLPDLVKPQTKLT